MKNLVTFLFMGLMLVACGRNTTNNNGNKNSVAPSSLQSVQGRWVSNGDAKERITVVILPNGKVRMHQNGKTEDFAIRLLPEKKLELTHLSGSKKGQSRVFPYKTENHTLTVQNYFTVPTLTHSMNLPLVLKRQKA